MGFKDLVAELDDALRKHDKGKSLKRKELKRLEQALKKSERNTANGCIPARQRKHPLRPRFACAWSRRNSLSCASSGKKHPSDGIEQYRR
jgi:hypothetical protein